MTDKIILGVAPVVRARWRVDHLAEVEQAPAAPPAEAPEVTAGEDERSPEGASSG
jgi:hypothetical protein